jgi:hypothetical protein
MKNIQISDEFDVLLDKLKERLGRPKKKIVEQLITYADKLKIDPEFLKEGDPSHEIRKTRNDLISFVKTQEKDHLKPLYSQLRLLVDQFQKTSRDLLKKEDYKEMEKRMVDNQVLLQNQVTKLQTETFNKETYKKQVHNAVNSYFKSLQESKTMIGNVKDREKIEEWFRTHIMSL